MLCCVIATTTASFVIVLLLLLPFQVARLEKPSEKFTCWICDDGPVEKLRMRIPGYVAGSRTIFTNGILRDMVR